MKRRKEALKLLSESLRPAPGHISTWAMCNLHFRSMLQRRQAFTPRSRQVSAFLMCAVTSNMSILHCHTHDRYNSCSEGLCVVPLVSQSKESSPVLL